MNLQGERCLVLVILSLTLTPSATIQVGFEQLNQWWQECEQGYKEGRYAQALPVCQRVVDALEPQSPEDPGFATALNNLTMNYYALGNYARAETLYLRSLGIREKALGPDHPDVATTLNNLAGIYSAQGNYPKAEPLLRRSLTIFEKALGPDHPDVARALGNLAKLYDDQGNYSKAEPLLLRSMAIFEKAQGPAHPDVARCIHNLATHYEEQSDYPKAEALLLRALEIREKSLGPEHPDVAKSLNSLGGCYAIQGKYAKAELLLLRSLRISEQALGPEHPDVAIPLSNLAALSDSQGDFAKAVPLYLRSMGLMEKVLGPDCPPVATILNNLAMIDVAQGHFARAEPRFLRVLDIRERALRSTTAESRIISLLDAMRSEDDLAYSVLLLKDAQVEARSLALRVSLLRKGRAAEAGLMTGWALQASLTTEGQRQRFACWQAVRSQHESLFLHGPAKADDDSLKEHQAQLTNLTNQIDDLEQELALAAPQLAQWKLPNPEQILSQVAARLPGNSAFIEVLWVKPYQFQTSGPMDARWEPARYVALILFPDQRIEFVDLGDAEQIDRAAGELLVSMRNVNQEPLREAKALYQKVMAPLLPKLGGVQRMYLSLDGSLNLVPFAALHDGQRYLLDAPYQILYLSSGRDLLRGALGQPEQPALVLADPDFGSKPAASDPEKVRPTDADTRGLYEELANLPQLQGARAEGDIVGGLLHVEPFLGAAATEARLRQVRSPWLLHIATHGLLTSSAIAGSPGARATMVGAQPKGTFGGMTGQSGDRSLSRSALALAGAAHAATASDAANDGLLTAEEARSLNLFGTQLVVLSACDTGRGAVKAGQGVYGLRRAFLAAGAETVVMSLWPVSDSGTRGLMQRYYRLLLDPKAPRGRISGLSEAMRAVKAERPHPYYWAPFIANGLDAPLRSIPSGFGPH